MARIERADSTVPVPVEQAQLQTTVQRTPFIDPAGFRFSTADAEAFKAVGGVLKELGKRKREMQDRIGISNINAAMDNAQREYQQEIIGKPLEEHAAILQKHKNNALAFSTQQKLSPETRKFADNKTQIWADTFSDSGELANLKAIEKDAIISVTIDYEKALTEGMPEDIVEAEAALNAQYKNSFLPGEAEELKTKAEKRAVKEMESNAVNAVHEAIEIASDLQTGTGDFTIAKELAKSPSIDGLTKTQLRNAINSAKTRFENARSTLNAAIQDQTMTETIGKLVENPNAIGQEDFNKLPLNDANKMLLAEKINKRAAAIKAGKPDPWIETTANLAATSAISRVLDGTREEVAKTSVSEIINNLGTITPAQVVELITKRTKRLDKTNVINTPAHQRAVGALNRLRDARLGADDVKDDIEKRNEVEGEFGRMQNELEAFAESIKGDSDFDTKILKKQQFLAKPIIEEVTLNWFERMFSPKEQGFFTAVGFNTEAEELVQEKMDILKDNKMWKTLSAEEKVSARQRFEQGATVQSILDLLNG